MIIFLKKKNASKLHTKPPIQSKAGTSNFTPGCFLDAENEKYVWGWQPLLTWRERRWRSMWLHHFWMLHSTGSIWCTDFIIHSTRLMIQSPWQQLRLVVVSNDRILETMKHKWEIQKFWLRHKWRSGWFRPCLANLQLHGQHPSFFSSSCWM